MTFDTLYLVILVVSMLISFGAAVGAVLAGLWLAGRLTGVLGSAAVMADQPDIAVVSSLADRERDSAPAIERVPWLDDQGNAIPVDPGKDEEAWDEAPD